MATEATLAGNSDGSRKKALYQNLFEKQIPIKLPGDPDWADIIKSYNTRLQYIPAVVVLPETGQHIIEAVLCATQNGVKVQARSGGHSYASFSTGGRDGAMVIDLCHFQDVSLDKDNIAKVGAGARLGNIALTLYNQRRAIPHGTCPAVGIGGHAAHGGFGMMSRTWGLTLDNIIAVDVVLADGRHLTASGTQNADVYFVSGLQLWKCHANSFQGYAWSGRLLWHHHSLLLPDLARPPGYRPLECGV